MDKKINIILKYLDNKNLVMINSLYNYYFLEDKNDEFSIIRVRKYDMVCLVHYDLINEMERFFSIEDYVARNILIMYVECHIYKKITNVSQRISYLSLLVD